MEAVLDCKGRLACYVDNETGLVENRYKGNKTSIVLQVGEIFKIERQDVTTLLKRMEDSSFEVESYKTK